MLKPAIPANEAARLSALRSYNILDTAEEDIFDAITAAAAQACNTPMASVTLIDSERQWFKSRVGLTKQEDPRDLSFCAHAIHATDLFLVPNAAEDPRFCANPLVTGAPGIRFYAGVPLLTEEGFALGTLCVIDVKPRVLAEAQIEVLRKLAASVMRILHLRRNPVAAVFAKAVDLAGDGVVVAVRGSSCDHIVYANESFLRMTGYEYHEVIDRESTFPVDPACQEAATALQQAREEARLAVAECPVLTKAGTLIWDRLSLIPFLNEEQKTVYTVVIHRDITEAKRAEAAQHRVEAMQTTLASIQHVVNNFLNTAQLFLLQAQLGQTPPSEPFARALESTKTEVKKLVEMTSYQARPTPFGFSLLAPDPDPKDK